MPGPEFALGKVWHLCPVERCWVEGSWHECVCASVYPVRASGKVISVTTITPVITVEWKSDAG